MTGAKPLSEAVLEFCLLGPEEQTSVIFFLNSCFFIQRNAFEYVCEMAARDAS